MLTGFISFSGRLSLIQILKSSAMAKVRLQIQIVTNQAESHVVTVYRCRYMNSQLIWFTNLVCMSFLSSASNVEIKRYANVMQTYYQTLRKNLVILETS